MKFIQDSYIANNQTLAILPAKQMEYDAIVLEIDKTLFIRQTPMQIIQASCLAYWSTYEGRRQAVIHHTGFKQKVPIPIDPYHNLFTFPTHAPKSIHCSWVFYDHILKIDVINKDTSKATVIQFKNGSTIQLDISIHTLQSQMERTWKCMDSRID